MRPEYEALEAQLGQVISQGFSEAREDMNATFDSFADAMGESVRRELVSFLEWVRDNYSLSELETGSAGALSREFLAPIGIR